MKKLIEKIANMVYEDIEMVLTEPKMSIVVFICVVLQFALLRWAAYLLTS